MTLALVSVRPLLRFFHVHAVHFRACDFLLIFSVPNSVDCMDHDFNVVQALMECLLSLCIHRLDLRG